jgi:hypothetical protein
MLKLQMWLYSTVNIVKVTVYLKLHRRRHAKNCTGVGKLKFANST